nr:venom protein [Lampona murina]
MNLVILIAAACIIGVSSEDELIPQMKNLINFSSFIPSLDTNNPFDIDAIMSSMTSKQKDELKNILDSFQKKLSK